MKKKNLLYLKKKTVLLKPKPRVSIHLIKYWPTILISTGTLLSSTINLLKRWVSTLFLFWELRFCTGDWTPRSTMVMLPTRSPNIYNTTTTTTHSQTRCDGSGESVSLSPDPEFFSPIWALLGHGKKKLFARKPKLENSRRFLEMVQQSALQAELVALTFFIYQSISLLVEENSSYFS